MESLGLFSDYKSLCDKLYQTFKEVAKSKIVDEEEGSVLYLIKRDRNTTENDDRDKVLSLAKLKTLEYRAFRKMREKLRNYYRNKSSKLPDSILSSFKKEMKCLAENNELPKPLSFYEDLMRTAFEFIKRYPDKLELLNEEYVTF